MKGRKEVKRKIKGIKKGDKVPLNDEIGETHRFSNHSNGKTFKTGWPAIGCVQSTGRNIVNLRMEMFPDTDVSVTTSKGMTVVETKTG